MAEQRNDDYERGRRRSTSRKGICFLMLLLGLIVGAGGGVYLQRSGLFDQIIGVEPGRIAPTPSRPTIIERVPVETVRTPRQCRVAIDGLRDALDDLEDVRRRLMDADIARSGANGEIADRAYSDVDQSLREALIAFHAETLQTAIDECLADGDVRPSSPPSPASPTPTRDARGTPVPTRAPETPGPTPTEEALPPRE